MSAPKLAAAAHLRLIRPGDGAAPGPVGLSLPQRLVAEFTATTSPDGRAARGAAVDGDVSLVVWPDGSWTYTVAPVGREPLVLSGGAHEPALTMWRQLLAYLRQEPAEGCA